MKNASTKEKIETLLNIFDDPGDGSPNILYCSINGEELDGTLPYDCLDNLDLEHCSRDDVVNTCMREFAEDDIDDEDFEDEDLDDEYSDDDDYEPIKSFYDRYSEEEINDIVKFITEWIKKQPDYESIKDTLNTDQGVEKYLGKLALSSEDENGIYWKFYKDITEEQIADSIGGWIDEILTDSGIISDVNNALNPEQESSISKEDIKNELLSMKNENSKITEEEIEQLTNEIYDYIKEEEMYSGEDYKNIKDVNIGDLFDSSTEGNIHSLGYKLLNIEDEED